MEGGYQRKERERGKELKRTPVHEHGRHDIKEQPAEHSRLTSAGLLVAGAAIGLGVLAWSLGFYGAGGDNLSADERAGIEQRYDEAIANGAKLIRPLDLAALKAKHERGELVVMGSDEQTTALIEDVERGVASASEVTLWDFLREDGDVVVLESSLFATEVAIFHESVTVIVPHLPGEGIELRAVRDGRGGITVGVMSSSGKLKMPILGEGASLRIGTP